MVLNITKVDEGWQPVDAVEAMSPKHATYVLDGVAYPDYETWVGAITDAAKPEPNPFGLPQEAHHDHIGNE